MNYTDQAVADAKTKEQHFKNFFGAVKALLRTDWIGAPQYWREQEKSLQSSILELQAKVHKSLLDNFDTSTAMQALVEMVTIVNKYAEACRSEQEPVRVLLVKKAAVYVTKMLRIFGVISGGDEIGFPLGSGPADDLEKSVAPYLDAIVAFRDKVRAGTKEPEMKPAILKVCLFTRSLHVSEDGNT